MYNFFVYYSIFAITTGITGYFSIYRPILSYIKEEYGVVHPVIEYPKLSAIILIIISIITAPFIIKTVLFGANEALTAEIISKFTKDDEI